MINNNLPSFVLPLKITQPHSAAARLIFLCVSLRAERSRLLFTYSRLHDDRQYAIITISLLAPLEWHYGDKNDYADEARLRLLRIFTNVSQGIIKRERVLKRMKFQSPLLASAAITR